VNAYANSLPAAPAAAKPVLHSLVQAQTDHGVFTSPAGENPDVHVVVGVSGGADSVCLLHALTQVKEAWQLRLHVAHLDHGLRPDSAQAAAFVAHTAADFGLPYHGAHLTVDDLRGQLGGLEAAARRARYAFLHDIACRVGANGVPSVVAVAHHKDDQAETVLMNFIRGCGLDGLAGMPWRGSLPVETPPRVRLVRPLLGAGRADIRAYLAAYDLAWYEDATNENVAHLRNQVRHSILPQLAALNPALVDTLARNAELAAAEANRAQQLDRAALDAVLVQPEENGAPPVRQVLDVALLAALDLATQRGVIRLALAHLGADLRAAGLAAVDRLLARAVAQGGAGGPHPLLGDIAWSLIPASASLRLSLHRTDALPVAPPGPYLEDGRTPQAIPDDGVLPVNGWELHSTLGRVMDLPDDWNRPGQPWRAFLDADRAGPLRLTTPRPGLQMAPLGLRGHHRTVGDFFTDRKVPTALRAGWPVTLDASDQVVWLCGLAVAHPARITPDTRIVRTLTWRRAEGHAP
jgi:tRNA(Ile)-lysidine synthase